ncbi:hypothetical protein [Calothrix sp. NIES-2100]|uniref:hypothetical protein n=1 Tax=Calothrix sp. NIES-2100 TaxID=1954172 RepID=UPI0030DD67C4
MPLPGHHPRHWGYRRYYCTIAPSARGETPSVRSRPLKYQRIQFGGGGLGIGDRTKELVQVHRGKFGGLSLHVSSTTHHNR